MEWALVSLVVWKSSEKVTVGTAYFLECFSVCSSACAAGSTLNVEAPECWVSFSVLQQDLVKEAAIGDKVRPGGTEAGPENSRKGACSAFTSSCAYAENNGIVFFPPWSFSLLVFQLYLLAFICFPIFNESCSSSKASLAPSFHVHSSHFPKVSRKSFLLLHTPVCSSFLVSTLLVLALHGEPVLAPQQMNLPHSYYLLPILLEHGNGCLEGAELPHLCLTSPCALTYVVRNKL